MKKLFYFKKEKILDIVIVMFFLLIFAVVGWKYLDPDFGWRLKTGEYILQYGIPGTDTYSYTMPSFPWVDHAWSQDVVIYLTYVHLGKFLQSFIWGVFALLSLSIVSNIFSKLSSVNVRLLSFRKKVLLNTKSHIANVFVILGFLAILHYFGIRVQVVTWLFFAGIVYVLFTKDLWNKYRKFIPVYFFVWANLHGGFASGLVAISIFLFFRMVRIRKVDFGDLMIIFLSLLITLINPYGTGLWREVWSSISDSQLRWRIQEWQPFILRPSWPVSFLMSLSGIFIFIYRRKFKLEELALYVLFFFQAMLSTRHVPLWTLITIPLGTRSIYYLYEESLTYKHGKKRFILFYKILWLIVALIFSGEILYSSYAVVKVEEGSYYPQKAVRFLKENELSGRMMSTYGWGGYLIWKYPDKQVYIDGRMPSWRWEANIPDETNSAADDFFTLLEGEGDLQQELEKYNIQTVLWESEGKKSFWLVLGEMIRNAFGVENKEQYSVNKELEELGWEKIYEDETAVIYRNY